MKDPTKARWFNILLALGLLWVGLDRVLFDRIAGSDPLAIVAKTFAIVAGLLMSALSIALLVDALRDRARFSRNEDQLP
jgi:hypothetical protein